MHGHHPETHNYRPACARTGLAAPRRPSLVIQKIHRLGVGAANNWLGRAMDEKPSNPTSTKMVAMQVRGTSRNLTGAAVCHFPISIAGSSTSKLRPLTRVAQQLGGGGQISGAMELRTGSPGFYAQIWN
jgi:hypothetical protein